MSEIISSSSVLLAIIGIVFGLWYKDLDSFSKLEITKKYVNRKSERDEVNNLIKYKAQPLFIFACVIFIIFLPSLVSICVSSISQIIDLGFFQNLIYYDTNKVAFIVIELSILLFAIELYDLLMRLKKKKEEINTPD